MKPLPAETGHEPAIGLLPRLAGHRYAGSIRFVCIFLSIALLTRIALLVHAWRDADGNLLSLAGVFLCGAAFDLAAAAYAAIPLHLYLWVMPGRWLASRVHRWLMGTFVFVAIYLMLFNAAAEWFFWEEFSTRFNFIAVDYLIYTTEVVGNIRESYPLGAILAVLALCTGLLFWGLRRIPFARSAMAPGSDGKGRLAGGLAGLALPIVMHLALSNQAVPEFGNSYLQELARNGAYSFFAAYRENELSYDQFYPTLPPDDALRALRPLLKEPNSEFVSPDPNNITRNVVNAGPEHRWNIIQVTVESLSSKFLGCFGNKRGLTPNLDRLFEEGIVFTNFYATGTRTVRGMEALTLSVPPTPGQSIVRRPQNENLFTLGSVLAGRGYDTAFLYSGFGYFDNMNAYFAANGYRVVDRASVPRDDITFATVWGACDEDLYRWTLRDADAAFARGRPFHYFVMTTSNHRPFGFPEGRIDLPPGKRISAVKYTDYAIGRLLEDARSRPWFTNTLFVIVADHCASAAGKTALPVEGYHIPAFIWNPSLVAPRKVGILCSQIDLPPTILGMMNWSYQTRFYGKDVLKMPSEQGRAFISTYQKMGYLTADRLAVLEPVRREHLFHRDTNSAEWMPGPPDEAFLREAASYYQSASYLFTHRLAGALRPQPGPEPARPSR